MIPYVLMCGGETSNHCSTLQHSCTCHFLSVRSDLEVSVLHVRVKAGSQIMRIVLYCIRRFHKANMSTITTSSAYDTSVQHDHSILHKSFTLFFLSCISWSQFIIRSHFQGVDGYGSTGGMHCKVSSIESTLLRVNSTL